MNLTVVTRDESGRKLTMGPYKAEDALAVAREYVAQGASVHMLDDSGNYLTPEEAKDRLQRT